ncbi:MAG: N-acetyltransferase [Candidatus Altiarchaeales archaeon ex4484_2]|nr:MAG: N-acetyltransferase [Candidatus Altiarchaeales archaeon ex4484_2]
METLSSVGRNSVLQDNVVLGLVYGEGCSPARVGDNAVIRSNSVIYCDVIIGDNLRTGHGILIREKTSIGDNVLIGSHSIIDGHSSIGSNVSIQSAVYIPLNSTVGCNVFIGPRAVLTNDKYPVRVRDDLPGPVLGDNVSVGANATLLPGVNLGEGCFIAAGSVVTKDVPEWSLAVGSPARIKKLPENLRRSNLL